MISVQAVVIHESGKSEIRKFIGTGTQKSVKEQTRLNIINSFYDTSDRVSKVIFKK